MSREISGPSLSAVLAQETGEAFLVLLTLDHPDLGQPIRVTSGGANLASGGHQYIAYPFDLTLPDEVQDRPPRARLVIDNVTREIVQGLRAIQSPVSVTIEIVRAADPDTIEVSYGGFVLRSVAYDALTVAGELVVDDFATEPYPAGRFVPSLFPGLF